MAKRYKAIMKLVARDGAQCNTCGLYMEIELPSNEGSDGSSPLASVIFKTSKSLIPGNDKDASSKQCLIHQCCKKFADKTMNLRNPDNSNINKKALAAIETLINSNKETIDIEKITEKGKLSEIESKDPKKVTEAIKKRKRATDEKEKIEIKKEIKTEEKTNPSTISNGSGSNGDSVSNEVKEPEQTLSCDVCNIKFAHEKVHKQHLLGKKHRKAVLEAEAARIEAEAARAAAAAAATEPNSNSDSTGSLISGLGDSIIDSSLLDGPSSQPSMSTSSGPSSTSSGPSSTSSGPSNGPSNGSSSEPPKDTPFVPPAKPTPCHKVCEFCRVTILNEEMWIAHVNSRMHAQALQTAKIDHLPADNVGAALMRKMGFNYEEGYGLGKHGTGIRNPLSAAQQLGQQGLGYGSRPQMPQSQLPPRGPPFFNQGLPFQGQGFGGPRGPLGPYGGPTPYGPPGPGPFHGHPLGLGHLGLPPRGPLGPSPYPPPGNHPPFVPPQQQQQPLGSFPRPMSQGQTNEQFSPGSSFNGPSTGSIPTDVSMGPGPGPVSSDASHYLQNPASGDNPYLTQ